jgi:hypothetical protein
MSSNEHATYAEPAPVTLSAAWAIKRALLGLGILTLGITVVASLLYATIETDPAETGSIPTLSSHQVLPHASR